MVSKCVLCKRTANRSAGITVHKCPTNPIVKREWEKFIEEENVPKYWYLCNLHFHKKSFEEVNIYKTFVGYKNKVVRLKPDAIPVYRRPVMRKIMKVTVNGQLDLPTTNDIGNTEIIDNTDITDDIEDEVAPVVDESMITCPLRSAATQTVEETPPKEKKEKIKKEPKRIFRSQFVNIDISPTIKIDRGTQTAAKFTKCQCHGHGKRKREKFHDFFICEESEDDEEDSVNSTEYYVNSVGLAQRELLSDT